MLSTLRFYLPIDRISPHISSALKVAEDLVNSVAIQTILIAIPLFYLHHNLFVLGFTVGMLFDEQTQKFFDIIKEITSSIFNRPFLEKTLFLGVGTTVALLAMPACLVNTTLYYSIKCGSLLRKYCKDHPGPSETDN